MTIIVKLLITKDKEKKTESNQRKMMLSVENKDKSHSWHLTWKQRRLEDNGMTAWKCWQRTPLRLVCPRVYLENHLIINSQSPLLEGFQWRVNCPACSGWMCAWWAGSHQGLGHQISRAGALIKDTWHTLRLDATMKGWVKAFMDPHRRHSWIYRGSERLWVRALKTSVILCARYGSRHLT